MSLAEFDELKWNHSAKRLDTPSSYLLRKARKNPNGLDELRKSLVSSTIYAGNLSFYTSEEQIYELFSKCGTIKRIIMGLDRFKFTPCGFCFIIYSEPQEALNALKYLSGTKLDDKDISIDLDPGFEDGRQFGRGKSGGQVSDELRFEFDASRGGFGIPLEQRIGNNPQYPQYNNYDRGAQRHHHHNQHQHHSGGYQGPSRFGPAQEAQQSQREPEQPEQDSNDMAHDQEEDNYIPQ